MIRFLALLLISGYVALIPACFFGSDHTASLVPSAHAASHAESAAAADCTAPTPVCAAAGSSGGGLAHHAGMYISFLGLTQAQALFLLAGMFLALVPFLHFMLLRPLLFRVSARIFSYMKKQRDILALVMSDIRNWLSFSINSPARNLVM